MRATRSLDDESLAAARRAVDIILTGHEPYPALAIDRHWTLVAANRAIAPLLEGVDASLLEPPVNVLRLSLHPAGLAPRIANYDEWRAHLLDRLRRQIDVTGDAELAALHAELAGLAALEGVSPRAAPVVPDDSLRGIAVPFQLVTPVGTLSFFSTTTIFGTPVDVTLSELALESFFPADAATADALRILNGNSRG